eukprot:gene9763-2090_t
MAIDWDCCIDCSVYIFGCICCCCVFLCCLPFVVGGLFFIYVVFPPTAIVILASWPLAKTSGTWRFLEREDLYARADPSSQGHDYGAGFYLETGHFRAFIIGCIIHGIIDALSEIFEVFLWPLFKILCFCFFLFFFPPASILILSTFQFVKISTTWDFFEKEDLHFRADPSNLGHQNDSLFFLEFGSVKTFFIGCILLLFFWFPSVLWTIGITFYSLYCSALGPRKRKLY